MHSQAILFFVVAVTAGILGFGGIVKSTAGIADIVFMGLLVYLLIVGIASAIRGRPLL